MATNFLSTFGQPLLQAGTNLLTNQLLGLNTGQQPGTVPGVNLLGMNLGLPQVAGAALLGGGILGSKEPGEALEARQFLRNRFTSPTALSEQFTTQVQGLQGQFQPLLDQHVQRAAEQNSQRFAAAFPGTVGAQGSEFGTFNRMLADEILPKQQAFLGQLGLDALQAQERAAGTILGTSKPDALSQLAAMMGLNLLTGGGGVGGNTVQMAYDPRTGAYVPAGTVSTTGQTGTGGLPGGSSSLLNPSLVGQLGSVGGLFQGGQSLLQGLGLLPGAASGAFATLSPSAGSALMSSLGALFPGAAIGGLEEVGGGAIALLGQDGAILGGLLPDGTVISGANGSILGNLAGGGGFSGMLSGQGLLGGAGLGSAGALLSGLGAGGAGAGLGYLIGDKLFDGSQTGGALAGAGTGALAGLALGGPVGAVIGALTGGLFGYFGGSNKAEETAQTEQETAWTSAQRPQALTDLQSVAQWGNQQQALYNQVTSALQAKTGSGSIGAALAQIAQQDPAKVQQIVQATQVSGATPASSVADLDNYFGWLPNQFAHAIEMPNSNTMTYINSPETGYFTYAQKTLADALTSYPQRTQAWTMTQALLRQYGYL